MIPTETWSASPAARFTPYQLQLHDRILILRRPLLVGVLNLTPDSFSDGGLTVEREMALEAARRLIWEGADILDVGAESSRPGAQPLDLQEELRRLQFLSEIVALGAPVSIDTYKPEVADWALNRGAHLINDITGLRAPMLDVVSRYRAPAIVMHMAGEPRSMQRRPRYDCVAQEVFDFLEERIERAADRGVATIADVGIGFGKRLSDNLELLRHLPRFAALGVPLLVGTSRKSMFAKLNGTGVGERLTGTLATSAWALERGVHMLRIHDLEPHRELVQVHSALAGISPRVISGSSTPSREFRSEAPTATPSQSARARLEGLPIELPLGVTAEERSNPQTVTLDVEMTFPCAQEGDRLEATQDYSVIPGLVQTVASERTAAGLDTLLLETLATAIAERLFRETSATWLRLRLHKPTAAAALGAEKLWLEREYTEHGAPPASSHARCRKAATAVIALGSNLGQRKTQLDHAVAEIRRLGLVTALSAWRETEPEGGWDHPRYLNGVILLHTTLDVLPLFEELQSIERRFGRPPREQRGRETSAEPVPRSLDLDLLFFDQEIIETNTLCLPHPRLHTRKFVLEPLVEVAPEYRHPKLGQSAQQLLQTLELSTSSPSRTQPRDSGKSP